MNFLTKVLTMTMDDDSMNFLRLWRQDLENGHTGSEPTELTYNGIGKFLAIIDALETENTSLRASRDEADKKLAFLKSKGITVGYMKTSDQPEPYLAYNIASGSELDNLPTVNKLIEAEAKAARLEGELYEARRAANAPTIEALGFVRGTNGTVVVMQCNVCGGQFRATKEDYFAGKFDTMKGGA